MITIKILDKINELQLGDLVLKRKSKTFGSEKIEVAKGKGEIIYPQEIKEDYNIKVSCLCYRDKKLFPEKERVVKSQLSNDDFSIDESGNINLFNSLPEERLIEKFEFEVCQFERQADIPTKEIKVGVILKVGTKDQVMNDEVDIITEVADTFVKNGWAEYV